MSTKSTTYPRVVYELTRNFNVRKVTLVRPFSATSNYGGYTARGVFYSDRGIFDSPKAAIKAGRSQISRRLKGIAASQNELSKAIDALNKAERTAAQAATDTSKG